MFNDVVIAGLITAASTAPISGYVAYSRHVEEMERLAIERLDHARAGAERSMDRRLRDLRTTCGQALAYLEDERPNAGLPPAERRVLLIDARRAASHCMLSARTGGEGGEP